MRDLTIAVCESSIIIKDDEGRVLREGPALVALDEAGKVYGFGVTPQSFEASNPAEWEQIKSKIRFISPCLRGQFEPKYAAWTINWLAFLAIHPSEVERRRLFRKDATRWQVIFPGYEQLSEENQDWFEYYVQRGLVVKVNALSINHQPKAISRLLWARLALRFGAPIAFCAFSMLIQWAAPMMMGEQYSAPLTVETGIVFAGILVALMVVIAYSTIFIVALAWACAMRPFLPAVQRRAILSDAKLGLPKRIMRWLGN